MSIDLVSQSTINESAAGIDEARYAAAWETSTRPLPAARPRFAALRRFARRPSARIVLMAPLLGAVGGAWWLIRRRGDR